MAENVKNEFEIIILLIRYFERRINTQNILFLLAFLTFGIGDAISASIMMNARGASGEANLFAAYVYANYGLAGMLAVKIWFTILLLAGGLMIYWRSGKKNYWMVNGFYASLAMGGIMATVANMQAAANLPFMEPTQILLVYSGIVLVFVEAGDLIDGYRQEKSRVHKYPWRNARIATR